MAKDLLPRDLIEAALDQIDLLRAMYPAEEELMIEDHVDKILSNVRHWCEDESAKRPIVPSKLSLTLILRVAEESEKPQNISLGIDAQFTEEPAFRVRVRQPDWLTKAEASQLAAGMPQDDVLSAIEHVREQANIHLESSARSIDLEINDTDQPLVRVWFYFPSISTREKRDDIVKYAPGYGLTGFLLAGKPGILCLEGKPRAIDEYMTFIKTESWGDIPPQHKKVSERHRETGAEMERMFSDMREITNQLEKRGERSNRSDMKALEAWLGEKGLGESFSIVLM
ncbi:Hypothetical predicted protein [Lecanosticta acicola]|uniref:Small nuclear ribonucleoprotein Prp3 C-terminal domain-containing protein n=1 Tax=Lecanosticta acicola TaxID=111012 RepID=A0AAI9E3X9_9PEZI|nr:Hypothetical predicted protein [Lecanosticta acicola]